MNPKKLLIAAMGLISGVAPAAESFSKEPPLFSMAPKTDKSVQVIARFGPVGMAIELHQPAFVMNVGKIEEGSPVAAPGDFKPEKPTNANRAPLQELNLKPDGATDNPLWIWTGDTLMNLKQNEALKMMIKPIAGTDYLFVETGGFAVKNKPDWKTQWFVMKRN